MILKIIIKQQKTEHRDRDIFWIITRYWKKSENYFESLRRNLKIVQKTLKTFLLPHVQLITHCWKNAMGEFVERKPENVDNVFYTFLCNGIKKITKQLNLECKCQKLIHKFKMSNQTKKWKQRAGDLFII